MCDEYGLALNRAVLPGGAHTSCHDAFIAELLEILRVAHVIFDAEPRWLLDGVIAPRLLLRSGRRRPAIIPDAVGDAALRRDTAAARGVRYRGPLLARRRWVFDAKTIYGGGGVYAGAQAAEQQSGAVAARALSVQGEYDSHAKRLDDAAFPAAAAAVAAGGPRPAGTTPVADRVRSWGGVRALVLVQYCECSSDVHDLIDAAAAADALARRHWARMGMHTQSEAKGYFVNQLRRRLGTVAMREMARHRLNRVHFVGMPRAVVEAIMSARGRAGARGGGSGSEPTLDDFHGWQAWHMAPAA